MKIGIFSTYDDSGAGNAAVKINRAFKKKGINSKLYVGIKKTKNSIPLKKNLSYIFFFYLKSYINKIVASLFFRHQSNKGFISLDLFNTKNSKIINNLNLDIIQINWINNFLSISDLNKIKKPIVWRLSDMWPFVGVEHFTDDTKWNKKISKKYIIDFEYLTWKKKREMLKKNISIVTPSIWLAKKAKKSYLMKNCNITVIPTPIDPNIYNLQKKRFNQNSIPKNKFIILFSAKYLYERRKGFEYFKKVTSKLNKIYPNKIHFVTVGKYNNETLMAFPKNTTHFGLINNEKKIVEIFNFSNLFFILSKKDNLPQTALEANMCGLPIIALNVGGVKEIIKENFNGNILKKITNKELKKIIDKYIFLKNYHNLKIKIRKLSKKKYSSELVVKKYLKLYKKILSNDQNKLNVN
ncbi:glycosyltransferase [Candidatus Pelagibacter sp.]|nr:glycosyltransferase [Candidatus Pelagibacter sp.]